MGSEGGEGDDDEHPRHEVSIRTIRMLAHEVTFEEFRRLIPDHRQWQEEDGRLPAVLVDWYEAYAYAAWLGGRLPTEAEWEYAARAGTTTRYWSGDSEEDLARVDWYVGNSEGRLHRVAEKEKPNPWGLHDVHGNAWEWVADWYGEYPDGPQVDPWGPPSGVVRVFRGGCFWYAALKARASFRYWWSPEIEDKDLGFRVVLPAAPSH